MKKHLWAICFSVLLVVFTVYIALDTFVIPKSYAKNAVAMNLSMFDETPAPTSDAEGDRQEEGDSRQAEQQDAPSEEQTEQQEEERTSVQQSRTSTSQSRNSDTGSSWGGNSDEDEEDEDEWGESNGWSGSSTQSSRSSRSNSSNQNSRSGWSDQSGWSDWSDQSDWSGWSGRGTMSVAESAEGVDAAAEYTGDMTYTDENISITLTEYEEYDTTIYVADVVVSSTQYIKAAFAKDTYGKNITESTSAMAVSHDAIFAVNGDYYGAQERGYVIRNGIVYRDSIAGEDVMCICVDGTMKIVSDHDYTAEELVEELHVWQAFTFGPSLVEDGEITVSQRNSTGRNGTSNPRTAVGMIEANHFVFVVADGRSGESDGLTLYELAKFMQSLGVETAYNLDGGGSSTMYFNGQVVNNPTSWSGTGIKERGVSDIVYLG